MREKEVGCGTSDCKIRQWCNAVEQVFRRNQKESMLLAVFRAIGSQRSEGTHLPQTRKCKEDKMTRRSTPTHDMCHMEGTYPRRERSIQRIHHSSPPRKHPARRGQTPDYTMYLNNSNLWTIMNVMALTSRGDNTSKSQI